MRTVLTESPEVAADSIKSGEVVAFPTETVYGLGADIFNEAAINKIFVAKGRPRDNPLIAHIHSLEQLPLLCHDISATAAKLIDKFFPGPLTIVLPKLTAVPAVASAGLDTIGVRMPQHDLAHAFLKYAKNPVAAPSANLSGRPSPTAWQAVFDDLDGRIACILKGEITRFGIESTVLDCSSKTPIILRPGSVSLEEIKEVAPDAEVASALSPDTIRSPGMRHRHYAPNARVIVVDTPPSTVADGSAYIGVSDVHYPKRFVSLIIVKDAVEYIDKHAKGK